jgi:methionine S-methyltransferase
MQEMINALTVIEAPRQSDLKIELIRKLKPVVVTGIADYESVVTSSAFVHLLDITRKIEVEQSFQVYSDLQVAFVISEEKAIVKALSKTVELLEGNTAPNSHCYYGCLFHKLLAFQLADRHPPPQVCRSLFLVEFIFIK